MKNLVKVVIPIYCDHLNQYEEVSLKQAVSVLKDYSLVIIKPHKLNLDELLGNYPQLEVVSLDDDFFLGISSYNRLMLSSILYESFIDSEYILIYQLDAYVFSDELRAWCEKGYDYVGAPWLVRPIYNWLPLRACSWIKKQGCSLFNRPNSQVTNFKVGNGGLSLRRVDSHLRVTRELKPVIDHYLSYSGNHLFHEDVFFAIEVNKHGNYFTYPSWKEALEFSFDKYPQLCYRENDERLPFGCHSWYKRKMKDFWFPLILKTKV